MRHGNCVSLEGYEFVLLSYIRSKGTTTVIMNVSGNGTAASILTSWILELSRKGEEKRLDGENLTSCEKKEDNGPWVPGAAQSTEYELFGDLGISGTLIEECVGSEITDPKMEFRLTFDNEIEPGGIRVAYLSGKDVFLSEETISVGFSDKGLLTPIEKSFCLYILIADGYKPESVCKVNISITKKCAFIAHEDGKFETGDMPNSKIKTVKTDILGSIKIIASIPLKSYQACGDTVYAFACDCFELNDTISYSNEKAIGMKDISICPKQDSYDITPLNSHCGKSVYRLDGEYIIDCK